MRLSADTFRQVTASLKSDARPGKEKRREPRVGLPGEVDYFTINEAGKRVTGVARVRDVSPSGIGMVLSKPVAKQQQFIVQLYGADHEPTWLVCVTAHCRRVEGGFYSVGAKITKVLNAEEIEKNEPPPAVTAPVAESVSSLRPLNQSDVERISRAILG